jgi:hypothetical protein
VGRPKGSVKSNSTKIVKNPKGREKYKAQPTPLTQVPSPPTILIQDLAEDTKIRYATAVRKGNNTLTELESITTISNISIAAVNFLALHDNKQIHCDTLMAYLKLLERTQPDNIKVFAFADMKTFKDGFLETDEDKKNYALRKMDRRFRTKAIFDYEWNFLPIIENNHFTMVVIHSHDNVNDILYYDSKHSVGTDEILAVHNYLLNTARRLSLDRYLHWNIKGNEASIFPAQTDGVSCGVYLLMIANCLLTNTDLSILTQDTMRRCRTRIAHAILEHRIPDLILGIPQAATEQADTQHSQHSDVQMESTPDRFINGPLPPLLRPTYSWSLQREGHSEPIRLVTPSTSDDVRTTLQEACRSNEQQHFYGNQILAHEDFLDLLHPKALICDAVDILIGNLLHQYDNVTHYPAAVTNYFSRTETDTITGDKLRYFQTLHDEDSVLKDKRLRVFSP